MKITFYLALLLATGLAFTSCREKKKEEPAPVITVPPNTMGAKIDNADWSCSNPVISNQNNYFILAGNNGNGHSITVSAQNVNGPGTFISNSGSNLVNGAYAEGTGAAMKAWSSQMGGTANLVITKYDANARIVSGTFSFTAPAIPQNGATGTRTVTNGAFTDVPIQ